MKTIPIIFLLMLNTMAHAQQLDTLLANSTHNLSLFFPSPIRQAVTGSGNFTFSYDRESAKHFGLLQAFPGTTSNLLVITSDGTAYCFLLEYREQLPIHNRFVSIEERIGNESSGLDSVSDTVVLVEPTLPPDNDNLRYRKAYFAKFSAYHTEQSHRLLASKRKNGLILRLLDLVYDRSEVYAVLEIENRSDIDFEVDYLNIFKVNGNRKRKSSFQKILLQQLYRYGFPKTVKSGRIKTFAVVLPKFTLGNTQKILIELQEKKGNRLLHLKSD